MDILLILLPIVLQIILIVKFFQLAGNVRGINEQMNPITSSHWKKQYEKETALGRNKEALFALQEYVWLRSKQEFYQERPKIYDQLKDKYESRFTELGGIFPDKNIIED